MNHTRISWTDTTWNPVHGCSHAGSPGCDNCYAERVSRSKGLTKLPWTGENAKANVQIKPLKLKEPFRLKEPSRVFVNSMSDIFHPLVPSDFIHEIFTVIRELPQHVFQILTKRPSRALLYPRAYPDNAWIGTSIATRKFLNRIDHLRRCNAKVRFLSLEPLLEPLGELNLEDIHWVIVGGESGPNHRPMDHAWAREIRDQCVEAGIPFFFKQSAAYKNETGTQLIEADGTKTVWHQFPDTPAPKPPTEQLTLL